MNFFAQIEDVVLNKDSPIYDIYIYHGCLQNKRSAAKFYCNIPSTTKVTISVKFDEFNLG